MTCSLDTKNPALINVTWYNGTNILNPENVSKSIDGNHITFWMEHPVTIFDNGKEISCKVTDGVQTKMSAKVPLDVQYAPRVECSITAPLVVGHPATVNCTINANPEVAPNSTVFPDELFDIGWVPNGSSISTSHLQPPCNKTFTIAATNNLGKGEATLLMDCFSCNCSGSTSGKSNSSSGQGVPVGTVVLLVLVFSVGFLLLGICLRHNWERIKEFFSGQQWQPVQLLQQWGNDKNEPTENQL